MDESLLNELYYDRIEPALQELYSAIFDLFKRIKKLESKLEELEKRIERLEKTGGSPNKEVGT